MRPLSMLLSLTLLACGRGVEMAPPPPLTPTAPIKAASVSGAVDVFVSAKATGARAVDPRADAIREALGLSHGARAAGAAATVKARSEAPPDKVVRPPSLTQSPVVAGDLIVGAALEPDAVMGALRPAPLGLDCALRSSLEGRLHLVRCTHADGRALTVDATRAIVDRLGRPAGIDFIELNAVQRAYRLPNDPLAAQQWHYAAMSLPHAWDLTVGLPEVVVAVIDSGIGSNPDLDPNVLPGIDLISDADRALDGDGVDDDPTDDCGPIDTRQGGSAWHGTHVAGTIAALSNNARGVAGVAWNSRILPVRVIGKGGGTAYDIAAGLAWATGGRVSGARTNQHVARIVNMSLGGERAPSQAYQTIIDAAVARGAIIVVAAGNEDTNTANVNPCNQDNLICVAAVDLRSQATPYTNYGSEVTISAPGGDINRDDDADGYPDGVLSTVGAGRYARLEGTSMATPHVAGLVALMRSVRPTLTLAEARQALIASASPIANCPSGCGAGVVDAWKAVSAVHPSRLPAPPELSLNATSLVVTKEMPQQTVRLTNRGSSPARVSFYGDGSPESRNVYWNAPSVPLVLAAGQSVELVLSYDAEITRDLDLPLSFACPESEVTFTLRVRAPRAPPRTVVLLMYQEGQDWKTAADTRIEQDRSYRLTGVPAGRYFLVGFADDDGDGRFEDGEGFGMWPSVEAPAPLEVGEGAEYVEYDFSVAPANAS